MLYSQSLPSEEKKFFFEKKNQKTFTNWASASQHKPDQDSKVFCFFFSKKKAFLPSVTG